VSALASLSRMTTRVLLLRTGLPSKDDTAAWSVFAADFESKAGFPNCGGSGDGVLIPIYCQTGTDPHVYISRKGFYALTSWQLLTGSIDSCMWAVSYPGLCTTDTAGIASRLGAGSPKGKFSQTVSTSLSIMAT
jgi:hypothetical protein